MMLLTVQFVALSPTTGRVFESFRKIFLDVNFS